MFTSCTPTSTLEFFVGCAAIERVLEADTGAPPCLQRVIHTADTDLEVEAGACLLKILKATPLRNCLASGLDAESFAKDLLRMFKNGQGGRMGRTATLALQLFDCCFDPRGKRWEEEEEAGFRASIIELGLPQEVVPLLGCSKNPHLFDLHWRLVEIFAQVEDGRSALLEAGIMTVMIKYIHIRDEKSIRHVKIVIEVSFKLKQICLSHLLCSTSFD
jgi:hypothetical protein